MAGSVTYNLVGKQATSTDAAGRCTTNVYDFNGNQIETEYPDGTVSRTVYDALGRQEYAQDRTHPDGGTTTAPATYSVYDASGRVIKTERCSGVELTKSVASPGTDFNGTTNEVQYKLAVLNAGTALSTNLTFYDAVGNVQYSVDGRGTVTQNQYDPVGNKTNVLVYTVYAFAQNGTNAPSPTGPAQSTSYTYDANGNQLTMTDANGNTTTSVYDSNDRLIEQDFPSAYGTVSQFISYDGLGRKIQEIDEAGVAKGYTYDFRGLLTSVTLAYGTTQAVTTTYQYDELGNMTNQTDAAGRVTQFYYDALGHRTKRILPGGQSEGFAYDVSGNPIYQTNFNGVIITNQYDVDNRLTNCSAMGYHTSYAYSQTGLRTNMVDASGVMSFTYNSLSQLTNKTKAWTGGPTISLSYLYDALGTITNIWSSTPNGVNLAYAYDQLGRITNVLANSSAAATYGYDLVGNLQSMRYGNGVTNLYQYDSRNRLTNLVWQSGSTQLASFAYTLGATGNRMALSETVNGSSQTYNWAYDYLYRLTGETFGGITPQSVTYGFDLVGNRTNRTSTAFAINNQTFAFTVNDWLSNDTYDANGNTTVSATTNYQYDVLNHLTNANNGAIMIAYDGDGNRVSKKVGSTTTYYLVDDVNPSGYAQVLEEWTSTGTPALSKVYNYGLALISQKLNPTCQP